jgi:hypothetical protein
MPKIAVFRHDDEPDITACLTNDGKRTLRLVMPGDGSLEGWRTPVIEWTFSPGNMDTVLKWRGCGNVNGIRAGEVFTLAPGESRDLGERILPRVFPGAAEFSAAITYWNDPTVLWRGVPLPAHDQAELDLVHGTDLCRVRSNEIKVSFEEYPAADALRRWFPEHVTTLRERWSDGITCDQLIALRVETQRQLGVIRADRGIHPGPRWILSDRPSGTFPAIRLRQWCDEPQISVRALILAVGRFHITSARVVNDLEQQWRMFRREHGLDVFGARTPNQPMRRRAPPAADGRR